MAPRHPPWTLIRLTMFILRPYLAHVTYVRTGVARYYARAGGRSLTYAHSEHSFERPLRGPPHLCRGFATHTMFERHCVCHYCLPPRLTLHRAIRFSVCLCFYCQLESLDHTPVRSPHTLRRSVLSPTRVDSNLVTSVPIGSRYLKCVVTHSYGRDQSFKDHR